MHYIQAQYLNSTELDLFKNDLWHLIGVFQKLLNITENSTYF